MKITQITMSSWVVSLHFNHHIFTSEVLKTDLKENKTIRVTKCTSVRCYLSYNKIGKVLLHIGDQIFNYNKTHLYKTKVRATVVVMLVSDFKVNSKLKQADSPLSKN